MKFFNFFIVVLTVVFSCSFTADADGLSYREKRELREAGMSRSDIRDIEDRMEYKYEGSSGTRYKYDLSEPDDRMKYKLDVDAQIKDKVYMPTKPGVKIDRGLNQYGGGVEK